MEERITVNRIHKDRLFISLFGSAERKENTLELYNAVNGTHYDNPADITIYTIEDALYMGMKNDLGFLIASHMNLYEHQGTYNPNMPLRGLLYLARLYEKYIKGNRLRIYGTNRVKLPTPRYLVFYNGTEDRPEKEELHLTERKAEVLDMLLTEYNEEEVMQGFYLDGLEDGIEKGRVLTYLNLRRDGMSVERAMLLSGVKEDAAKNAEKQLDI